MVSAFDHVGGLHNMGHTCFANSVIWVGIQKVLCDERVPHGKENIY